MCLSCILKRATALGVPARGPLNFTLPVWAVVDKAEFPHSCTTFYTALCLAVGHLFTGEYTHRFKRDFQPLDIICKCGYEERTILHILFDCPLFQHARDEACIDNNRLHPTIYNLFSTIDGAQQLFQFLE
jgi:hypothetical protein